MKRKKTINFHLRKTNETLGFFGRAQLVRRFDGHHELTGGTLNERAIAREWCLRFAPEVVFAEPGQEGLVLTT